MTDKSNNGFSRRDFVHGALAGAALAALPVSAFSADSPDIEAVLSQIPKMHDENVKRLQNRCEGIRALNDLSPTVLDKAPADDCAKWQSGVTLHG